MKERKSDKTKERKKNRTKERKTKKEKSTNVSKKERKKESTLCLCTLRKCTLEIKFTIT